MCELFGMSAERPAIVEYTLHRFAAHGGERHRNRDGWGIAFAEDRDAHVFREAAPVADSALAHMVVARGIPSRYVIAHVRRASRGTKLLANTHPFARVNNGRLHLFAHNGTLHGIEDLAGELRGQCVGDTDSELAFLLLMRDLEGLPYGTETTADRFDRFSLFAARMARLGDANFLFFDGEILFAHAHKRIFETPDGLTTPRPPGLVMRDFSREPERPHWHAAGARIGNLPRRTVLLASVPLNDEGWQALPEGYAMALRDGRILHEASTASG